MSTISKYFRGIFAPPKKTVSDTMATLGSLKHAIAASLQSKDWPEFDQSMAQLRRLAFGERSSITLVAATLYSDIIKKVLGDSYHKIVGHLHLSDKVLSAITIKESQFNAACDREGMWLASKNNGL